MLPPLHLGKALRRGATSGGCCVKCLDLCVASRHLHSLAKFACFKRLSNRAAAYFFHIWWRLLITDWNQMHILKVFILDVADPADVVQSVSLEMIYVHMLASGSGSDLWCWRTLGCLGRLVLDHASLGCEFLDIVKLVVFYDLMCLVSLLPQHQV